MHSKNNNKSQTFIQGLRPFSSSIPKTLKKHLRKGGYNYSNIVDNWTKMVSKKIADACYPITVKMGKEMKNVVKKAIACGNEKIMVCERGFSFGYNNLVSDMRSLEVMKETGCPVIFDATHSVQMPGGLGQASGGQREMVPVLARAAVAVGISGLFVECHPDPEQALSDGPNSWPLKKMESLLETLLSIDSVIKQKSLQL